MKTKPILITLACIIVLAGIFFLVKAKFFNKQPQQAGIKEFLNNFNRATQTGNPDTLIRFFDIDYNKIARVFDILDRRHGATFKSYPIFKFTLNTDDSKITTISPGIANVDIPITFTHDSISTKKTILTLTLSIADPRHIKISGVNGTKFLSDYIAYENLVKNFTLTDKNIYSPITLSAFKTADALKAKYDSVIWFEHINNKTYYYVISGKWKMDEWDMDRAHLDTAKTYKMGLVGPDLKEIIPLQYDLIHNIGSTFSGLIEVEKDHKRGFYNLNGRIILPVEYDQIFPVTGSTNLAALRKGSDYYWLKNDTTVSEKTDLKISDIIANLKQAGSNIYKNDDSNNIMEFNSRDVHSSIYVTPSYLADLNVLPAIKTFTNPLRKNVDFEDASSKYIVKLDKDTREDSNWLASAVYSIRDYFLGGRAEFYDSKNIVIVDRKTNRAYSHEVSTDVTGEMDDYSLGSCNEYNLRALNDSLFELKISSIIGMQLYNGDILVDGPVYHYLTVKDDKLVELPTDRTFAFTKFVKMDDAYLAGCYSYSIKPKTGDKYTDKQTEQATIATLQCIKNEIFADYNYAFKDTVWCNIFKYRINYKPENASVDDSLTVIDKYNINWINQKLQGKKLALK